MRKKFIILASFLSVVLLALVAGGLWWKESVKAPGADITKKRFVIKKGETASQVGAELQREGLIKSYFAFKLYLQLSNRTKNLPVGEFDLPSNLSLTALVDKLMKGPDELWVTIPEGLRREELPEKFISTLLLTGTEAQAFKNDFLSESEGYEGKLFPDTYLFPPDSTATLVIDKMLTTFETKIASLEKTNNNLTLDQSIVLASIVERETKTDGERPIVAGILLKRLSAGWPLEVDASIQYIVSSEACRGKPSCQWWPQTTVDDRQTPSAYNTYLHTGLPPAAISNPGLSSLRAAFNPQDSDYWFYLHDEKGIIHFAKTNQEHNQNIRMYLGN